MAMNWNSTRWCCTYARSVRAELGPSAGANDKAASAALSVVGRVGGFDARPSPIHPSGTFPRGRGKGAGGRPFAVQQTDRAQPDSASPAGGRRWRAAPDEEQPHLRLSWSRRSDVAPIRPSDTFPPAGGEGSLVSGGGNGESEFVGSSPGQALCNSLRAAARASLLTSTPPSMRANSSWRACGPSSSTALWVMPSTGALLTR